jgi:hypothetical protein
MGHADIQTTMRYVHYAPRDEDGRLGAEAFGVATPVSGDFDQDVPSRPRTSRAGTPGIAHDLTGLPAVGDNAPRRSPRLLFART